MNDVIIIGGGAAGMMAAITAARNGKKVLLFEGEKNCGRKLRITGKGRCNVTNNCDCNEFLRNIVRNSKFIKPSLYRFTPADTISFFEELGVPLKTERGNRVFPVSDKAESIVNALTGEMKKLGVKVVRSKVKSLILKDGRIHGVSSSSGENVSDKVIICTGGMSYPATGSTGDGYRMAKDVGHTIVPATPSLVPIEADDFCADMQGLPLRNVELKCLKGNKVVYKELGEMLFTHFGVSGPLVLSASTFIRDDADYKLLVDLKPGLSFEKLDERIQRDFKENINRSFKNSLGSLLPQKMIPVIIRLSGIDEDCRVNSITREQRLDFCRLLKEFPIKVLGLRPIDEAIVTAGGVSINEIDPRSMESKIVKGLYFAGEVLDVDGFTGGFNLQIAWSTAQCAGNAV